MPWTQTDPVTERQKFVRLVLKGQVTMTQACEQFGISRKTGYKILARHAELGMTGLADASRAPKTHPNQAGPEVEAAVLRVRKAHPTWGSKKILWALDRERPDQDWPARSTVDAILKRAERRRSAVRIHRSWTALAPGRVARASWRRAASDRARPAGPEWSARAIPRDPESGDRVAAE